VTVKRQPIPFGKYLLLDRVNIGGMAEVWRGKTFGEEGFEKLVAIKRILPNIAEDEEFITMFIDEAKISVQLTHANVAQVFDLGKIGDSYYIAMEYVSGKDLRAIFDKARKRGEPAPIPLTCFVLSKAAEGLDYAHRKRDAQNVDLNIVHRDVSPQNILCSYDGETKVIDFGIAKAANKATKTQAGILKGKFGYMSPEQVRGMPLDRRSDVFALGVVLYEMLTGERLFVGESDFSVLEKVRAVDILPPETYNRRIPPPLSKIVLKALAKDVEERFQYASELGDALQRFLITSDSIFSRTDLMQFMKSTFAEDVEREKTKLAEYAEIKLPPGMMLGSAPTVGQAASAPIPAPSASAVVAMRTRSTSGGSGASEIIAQASGVGPLPNQSTNPRGTSDATMIGSESPVGEYGTDPTFAPRATGRPSGSTGSVPVPRLSGSTPLSAMPGAPVGRPGTTPVFNGRVAQPVGSMAGRGLTGQVPALGQPPLRVPTGQVQALNNGRASGIATIPNPPPMVSPAMDIGSALDEELQSDQTIPPAGRNQIRPPVMNTRPMPPRNFEADEPSVRTGGSSKGMIFGILGLVVGLAGLGAAAVNFWPAPTGALVVVAQPATGVVWLDGKPVADHTPYVEQKLKAGPHHLEVQASGYVTFKKDFDLPKDGTEQDQPTLVKSSEGGDNK
jgi:serine/threonine protein kinase